MIEQIPQRQEEEPNVGIRENSGYFRNIINRLLYNMQIFMQKINVRLIDQRQEMEFRQAFFTINSMSLKNSLIILEANIIKKTLNLQLLHLRHPFGEVQIKDLNICLDFNNRKVSIIAILSHLQLDVYKLPIRKMTRRLSRKKSKKQMNDDKHEKGRQLERGLELSLFVKVSSTQVASKLVKMDIGKFQSTIHQNISSLDCKVNFEKIALRNCVGQGQGQNQILLSINYLPIDSKVKIFSQFQDNIIKSTYLYLKKQTIGTVTSIQGKIYHLCINFDCNQMKGLLDHLLEYEKEISHVSRMVKKKQFELKNRDKMVQRVESVQKVRFSLLVYRLMLRTKYESVEATTFGTVTFTTPTQQQHHQQHLIINKRKSRLKRSTESSPQKQQPHLLNSNYKIKILQFGVNIANYNICSINQLQSLYDGQQIIVNGCSLIVEMSLKFVEKMREIQRVFQRDVAYYWEKYKKFISRQVEQKEKIEQNKGQKIDDEGQYQLESKIPKLYLKINQILLRLGQLTPSVHSQSLQSTFISIIEIQLVNILFSMFNKKCKLKTDLIAYLYSPYTLQKNPLTNELLINIGYHLKTKELSINFKNNFVILIDDQYANIIYKLFDKESIWCQIRNLTKQKIKFLQEIVGFEPLIGDNQSQKDIQNEDQTYYHTVKIDSFQVQPIFWLHSIDFKMVIEGKRTQYVHLNRSQQIQQGQQLQQIRQLFFEDDSESGYILRMIFNKLNNLCEIILDYKTHIVSYSDIYEISLRGKIYPIEVDPQFALGSKKNRLWEGGWYNKLEEISQEPNEVNFIKGQIQHSVDTLMINDEFTLFGLVANADKKVKRYQSYLLQNNYKKNINFTIMPFLIIKNTLQYPLLLQIVQKKSQQKQEFTLLKGNNIELNKNQFFDYYMKQFIIKLTLISQKGNFESDSFYFNTYSMVDQITETIIQMRSTQKENYTKRSLIFQEGLILKSKLIILRNSLKIVNHSDFGFSFRVKPQGKQSQNDEIFVERRDSKEWCCRLKRDTVLQILIINQNQTRIEVTFGEIKEAKILSFNFCKLQDKYYNLLVKIQSRFEEGLEIIELQNFVEIINLCHYVERLQVEQQGEVPFDHKVCLPLNSTSLNKYNNKAVAIDDMNKIYAEMFLTAKVTDQPLKIDLDGKIIAFSQLIKQSSQQLQLGTNRYVFTLLKDMNYNRITFYLTDRLYNQKMSYTIFHNPTHQHFLLSDDSSYSHHFIIEDQVKSAPPEKIFIPKNSLNCLINKENHDILLCDQHQKHLQKVEKRLLEKEGIRLQQYQFDAISLYDCSDVRGVRHVKRQVSTKGIEVRVKMFRKIEVSVSIKGMTLRFLENNKLDCLIQDISIKNQDSKDHLLRIPEETYLLLEANTLDSHFFLIKNAFLKCKNIIVNIRRQMPYSFINLASNLIERMGLRSSEQDLEGLPPRKVRQKIKKLNGQTKLKQYINQLLFLVKNIFIHQIHLSLTIQLQNLSFSNVIILPQYEITNKFIRQKNFKNQVINYYLTNLLAKFPKLSFLMSNFKNPMNTFKLFFNIRDAMKEKIEAEPIVCFRHEELPENPFVFSVQRWNHLTNYLTIDSAVVVEMSQKIISFIYQNKKQTQSMELTDLESVRIIKNRANSDIILRFKNNEKLMLIEDQKKCLTMLNNISQVLL